MEGTPCLLTKVLLRLCGKCWGLFHFQCFQNFHRIFTISSLCSQPVIQVSQCIFLAISILFLEKGKREDDVVRIAL